MIEIHVLYAIMYLIYAELEREYYYSEYGEEYDEDPDYYDEEYDEENYVDGGSSGPNRGDQSVPPDEPEKYPVAPPNQGKLLKLIWYGFIAISYEINSKFRKVTI